MRTAALLLANAFLLAAMFVAYRERDRRERERGIEKPPPYRWPKPPRLEVRPLGLRVARRLMAAAIVLFVAHLFIPDEGT